MVSDLDNVCVQIVAVQKEARFASLTRVAHEQLPKTICAQENDDAILIHVIARIGEQRQ